MAESDLKPLETFPAGMSPFSPAFRDALNALSEICYQVLNMTGKDGIVVSREPTGITISVEESTRRSASGRVIPVKVTQDGGSDGDEATKASWTYTVDSLDESVEYMTAATPWNTRPDVGKVEQATFGYLHIDEDGDYELGWVNEQVGGAVECS